MGTAAARANTSRHAVWQFARLATPYWNSGRRWQVRGATALLLTLTMGQVALVIWTSYWNRGFFDALEARSLGELARQIAVFALILGLTMAVTALHMHVKRWLQLDWRRWLTRRLVDQWMTRARHYRLQFAQGEHDNPDQRIAEDIRIATEAAISLAHSLTYSVLIGLSFFDILLTVSGSAPLPGTGLAVPGYMVVLAFLYAGVGSTLGFFLGRPLVSSTNRLQTVEANLRFSLARAREHSESIALMHGEGSERRGAARLFGDVAQGWNRQTLAYLGIVSFSTAYGNLLPVFPILVAAPQYIAGTMGLGLLMQAAQAFQQLTSALSWPVDHLGELAYWRASAERVVSLHHAMLQLERPDNAAEGAYIRLANVAHAELDIRHLQLSTPAGQPLLDDFNLRVRRGERVLLSGDPDVTLALFKAVAGLWPWGSGAIDLPRGQDLAFMPQHPFLPAGSLRAVLCYPRSAQHYSDASLHRALECAGLAWLAPRLEESDDWNQALPLRAQQRLGMARLFLHQPAWVFLEEAIDSFDAKGKACMLEMLHRELPNSTLLAISRHSDEDHFYDRKLELRRAAQPGAPTAAGAPALPEV
jgi:vitamin B12/bleomycin/antimicrobial peptide transport system ATP-binding/permease protein